MALTELATHIPAASGLMETMFGQNFTMGLPYADPAPTPGFDHTPSTRAEPDKPKGFESRGQ